MKSPKMILASALLALAISPLAALAGNDYAAAKQAALTEIDKAKDVGYEWRDSRKILKEADAAAEAGNTEKAITLAKIAEEQGKAAVKQAKEQSNAGPR